MQALTGPCRASRLFAGLCDPRHSRRQFQRCCFLCSRSPPAPTSTSMLVKAVQLGVSRCAGRATIADSPRGQGCTPSTGAR
eukprot:12617203-Alexandrium_andersonii.AAC.1